MARKIALFLVRCPGKLHRKLRFPVRCGVYLRYFFPKIDPHIDLLHTIHYLLLDNLSTFGNLNRSPSKFKLPNLELNGKIRPKFSKNA